MNHEEVDAVLTACEIQLATRPGVDLSELGFWKVVGAAKRDPSVAERFGERIARIDREAFERWAAITVPTSAGTALMGAAAVASAGVVVTAPRLRRPWDGLALLAGTGALLTAVHGLAHLVVGRLQGMRFSSWFIGSWKQPQPGVKIDYESYLRVPAEQRAWMHASGALVGKVVPFVALLLGRRAPRWSRRLLLGLGIVQVVTDVLWSTKASDWKRFRREMDYAS